MPGCGMLHAYPQPVRVFVLCAACYGWTRGVANKQGTAGAVGAPAGDEKGRGMERAYMRYVLVGLAVLGTLVLSGFYMYRSWVLTPEEKILAGVERLRLAGAEKSARRIMAELSPGYRDDLNPNREELTQKVQYWCMQNLSSEVTVEMNEVRVQVLPEAKAAKVHLRVSGNKPVMDVLNLLNPSGKVEIDYIDHNGNWLIQSVRAVK